MSIGWGWSSAHGPKSSPAAGGGSSDREKDVAAADGAIDTKKYENSNKTKGIVRLASHKRVKRKE